MISAPIKLYSGKLVKKHKDDAGFDVFSSENLIIKESNSVIAHTNLRLKIPEGYVGFIKSRSGLSFKHNIETGAGVIDSGFIGEIKIHLYNHGFEPYKIREGDRIAQLVILKCDIRQYITEEEIDTTDRGEDGFGSTGK